MDLFLVLLGVVLVGAGVYIALVGFGKVKDPLKPKPGANKHLEAFKGVGIGLAALGLASWGFVAWRMQSMGSPSRSVPMAGSMRFY